MNNLYLVSRNASCPADYEHCESMVVAASNEESALRIHPEITTDEEISEWVNAGIPYDSWVIFQDRTKLSIEFIGNTEMGQQVVHTSYKCG